MCVCVCVCVCVCYRYLFLNGGGGCLFVLFFGFSLLLLFVFFVFSLFVYLFCLFIPPLSLSTINSRLVKALSLLAEKQNVGWDVFLCPLLLSQMAWSRSLRCVEELETLPYRAHSQRFNIIVHLQERDVERGSAVDVFVKRIKRDQKGSASI